MSTELTKAAATELAIRPDQTEFTPVQKKALEHIGVDQASEGDLQVFFHQAKRTGLDPFARQIHMIGRRSSEYNPETQEKTWTTKYTIQTGIDGFRLIGRRAAEQTGETISMDQAEWLAEDGTWRPAWSNKWGLPIAARVTIKRNGQPFTAVAMFDEYAQKTRQGNLTQMWQQRPAGQLSKCAEALAWRMAFPQDLAGLYTAEEMDQATNSDTQMGYQQQEQAQAQQEAQDAANSQQTAQQALEDAWDNLEQLENLGKWAKQQRWSQEWVNAIRDRWTELNNQQQAQQQEDIVDAEVIDEPEN
jgi:phage recombination protein Bet